MDNTHILVRDVDPATSGTFRDLVNNQFTDWTVSPAAGEANGYLLTMKPSVMADFATTRWTSRSKPSRAASMRSGLTEPTIAFTGRGDNEILVELARRGRSDARQGRDPGRRPACN